MNVGTILLLGLGLALISDQQATAAAAPAGPPPPQGGSFTTWMEGVAKPPPVPAALQAGAAAQAEQFNQGMDSSPLASVVNRVFGPNAWGNAFNIDTTTAAANDAAYGPNSNWVQTDVTVADVGGELAQIATAFA